MFQFIFVIAVISTATKDAKLISPHELTREEAELIAERMPKPQGSLFLNGEVAKRGSKESTVPLLCRFNGPRLMPRKPKNPPGGRWTWQVISGPGRSWHYEWVFVEGDHW